MNVAGWLIAGIGTIAIVAGILLIRNRTVLSAQNAMALRAFFGPAGEQTARNSTPVRAAITGCIFVALGIGALVFVVIGAINGRFTGDDGLAQSGEPSNPAFNIAVLIAAPLFMAWGLGFIIFRRQFLRWASRRYNKVSEQLTKDDGPSASSPPKWFPVFVGIGSIVIGFIALTMGIFL